MNRLRRLAALAIVVTVLAGGQALAAPRILILGSSHLGQMNDRPSEDEVANVNEALEGYEPDMVAVEYLPPDWPVGKGRDYRPDVNLKGLAKSWEVPFDRVEALVEQARGEAPPEGREATCRLARLLFLHRDFPNAVYYFQTADCPAEAYPEVENLVNNLGAHEMARIGFVQARRQDLPGVVSFDYQGDDAEWFMFDTMAEAEEAGGEPAEKARALQVAVEEFRARNDEEEQGSLIEDLRWNNSEAYMDQQRRFYEEVMTRFDYKNAGRRQLDNYWLRNERMFDNIEHAAEARGAERILVVVGSGHKYFLDEIARQRGWEWVDPLRYLDG